MLHPANRFNGTLSLSTLRLPDSTSCSRSVPRFPLSHQRARKSYQLEGLGLGFQSLMKPYIVSLLLLSSGNSYAHLSATKYLATSTTCVATSQNLGVMDEDPDCNLHCSLSSEVIVQTDVRQDKEAKRFLFLLSKVEADCPGLDLSQLVLPVRATVKGDQEEEDREAEPLWGFSPEARDEVRAFSFFEFEMHKSLFIVHLLPKGKRSAKGVGEDIP